MAVVGAPPAGVKVEVAAMASSRASPRDVALASRAEAPGPFFGRGHACFSARQLTRLPTFTLTWRFLHFFFGLAAWSTGTVPKEAWAASGGSRWHRKRSGYCKHDRDASPDAHASILRPL